MAFDLSYNNLNGPSTFQDHNEGKQAIFPVWMSLESSNIQRLSVGYPGY
jgi:hypothetical protein